MADFDKAFPRIIKHEGGYVETNDPDDPGGRTFAGISERHNPDWEGWELLDEGKKDAASGLAYSFYRKHYWDKLNCSQIPDQRIANIVFSTAVLSGVRTAATLLIFSSSQEAPAKMTLLRIARYSRLADRNPKLAKFFRGWCNRALADFGETDE